MERHGRSLILSLLLLFCFSEAHSTQADDGFADPGVCAAEKAYLAHLNELQNSAYPSRRDYSCLIDPASLSDRSAYQLVDIRKKIDAQSIVPEAWSFTVRELRHSQYLKSKRLLLLSDGFSRVNAAKDCAVLRSAGYDDVKILVGGADAWRTQNGKRYLNTSGGVRLVSANELIHEYSNGNVILVAGSELVADELRELGLSHIQTLRAKEQTSEVFRILADESGGGYYPVVLVTGKRAPMKAVPAEVGNLYVLNGTVRELSGELAKKQWINVKRNSVPRRCLCERT